MSRGCSLDVCALGPGDPLGPTHTRIEISYPMSITADDPVGWQKRLIKLGETLVEGVQWLGGGVALAGPRAGVRDLSFGVPHDDVLVFIAKLLDNMDLDVDEWLRRAAKNAGERQ